MPLILFLILYLSLFSPINAAPYTSPFIHSPDDISRILGQADAKRKGLIDNVWLRKHSEVVEGIRQSIKDTTGIEMVGLYVSLGQFASAGEPYRNAGAGRFELHARKVLFEQANSSSILGFHVEEVHQYTPISPSRLHVVFRSILPTTNSSYEPIPLNVNELWIQQTSGDNAIVRVGKISSHTITNGYAFDSSRLTFIGDGFASDPTVVQPSYASGIVAGINLYKNFYTAFSVMDARDFGPFIAREQVYFKSAEVGYHTDFKSIYNTDYHVMFWETDASPSQHRKEARGMVVLLQNSASRQVIPFLKMGFSNGEGVLFKQFTATGVGIVNPFADEGLIGIGGIFSTPTDVLQKKEYAFEAFYRIQLTSLLQITPDIQLIQRKPQHGGGDWVNVFSLRARLLE
jgi:porin